MKTWILAAVIAASTSGQGTVYRWTGPDGSVRASNSLSAIPEGYRSSAVEMKVVSITQGHLEPVQKGFAKGRATIGFTPSGRGLEARAIFNGRASRMAIMDTGSDMVAITTKLARALGYDTAKSRKTWVATSSGRVQVPVVLLEKVKVGGAEAFGVQAVVMDFEGRGPVSALMGMNFLSLFVFEIDSGSGTMTLVAPN
ncbi:MAG: retroviral-like aspartic protease family protein [Nitrospinota bacterium]|nr:retroviral-like aspartic protease family protein [Nitrospinota bacterium]